MRIKFCDALGLTITPPRHILRLARKALVSLQCGGVMALYQRFRSRRAQARMWLDYRRWVAAYDTLTDLDDSLIRQQLPGLPYTPLISIVMPTYNTQEKWL